MAGSEQTGMLELRWRRMGFVLLAVAGIATLTVGYSLQRRAHDVLGVQIKAMEKEAELAKASALGWRENLARLQRRDAVLRRAAEMHLDLVNIVPSQRRVIPLLPRASVAGSPPAAPSRSSGGPVPLGPLTGSATFTGRANR